MTVLGDLAQSTGPWSRSSWSDIEAELQFTGTPCRTAELEVGYRVPSQTFELAKQLLPRIAPAVRPPRVVRNGPEPTFHLAVDGVARATATIEQARNFASLGLTVGVIAPSTHLQELADQFQQLGVRTHDLASEIAVGINILDPETSKGLEFDAVVVVEPEEIARSGPDGLSLLYIALTRTTRHLAITHIGAPMPSDQGPTRQPGAQTGSPELAPPEPSSRVDAQPPSRAHGPVRNREMLPSRRTKTVDLLAQSVAADVMEGLPPDRWDDFVCAPQEELGQSITGAEPAE